MWYMHFVSANQITDIFTPCDKSNYRCFFQVVQRSVLTTTPSRLISWIELSAPSTVFLYLQIYRNVAALCTTYSFKSSEKTTPWWFSYSLLESVKDFVPVIFSIYRCVTSPVFKTLFLLLVVLDSLADYLPPEIHSTDLAGQRVFLLKSGVVHVVVARSWNLEKWRYIAQN